jgi:type VI secretion system protein VasG
MIDSILTNTMLPALSRDFLARTMRGEAMERVCVSVVDDDFAYSSGDGIRQTQDEQ